MRILAQLSIIVSPKEINFSLEAPTELTETLINNKLSASHEPVKFLLVESSERMSMESTTSSLLNN